MNKAVMISTQPSWCELIASGRKTIEVRKNRPQIETPFKCYIYCTKNNGYMYRCRLDENRLAIPEVWNGKVIGEFVCDYIDEIMPKFVDDANEIGDYTYYFTYWDDYYIDEETLAKTCLTGERLCEYGDSKTLYGWHISDLVIYDKPRELGEFKRWNKSFKNDRLTCPPQSWCYVEAN